MLEKMTWQSALSAEELERLSIPDRQVELVRGRLVVRAPPSTRHGVVAGRLAFLIHAHVEKRGLGLVCPQDTGFQIGQDPDTVRAPDVAFVTSEQARLIPPQGYAAFAPALVVEVVSPGDRFSELEEKVADWLAAGSRLVWVVDPGRGRARVYRADGGSMEVGREEPLEGGEVLPGFSCRVIDILS